jgi:hypothetical protein
LRFTRAWGPLVVGRGCIWSESSSKQLRLCQKKWYPPSRNIDEVESNVQQTWQLSADISDQNWEIHLSMRQRCVAVIWARGGHMRYQFYSVIFSFEGYVQSIGLHWALLSNISMWIIAITKWNLYHLLCIKAVCLYSFNSRNYWVNT